MLGCTWCLQRKVLLNETKIQFLQPTFTLKLFSRHEALARFGPRSAKLCRSNAPTADSTQLWVVDRYSSPGDLSPTESMANVEAIVKQEEARLHNLHPTTNDVPGCMKLFDDFLLCHGKSIRFDSDYSI